jgi:hypothetical protein
MRKEDVMAKFYRPRGSKHPAVLWDAKAGKAAYSFFGGVCETEDPKTISLLREMGFSEEPISQNVQIQMAVAKDLSAPRPGPPPKERMVPAIEPKVLPVVHAKVPKATPPPKMGVGA